ncbi:MAG: YggU family protein [Bdellovibrionaceae bacterium]|nr:YggU family protein [Pseudobdellovibrionaceae bacterium]
MITKTVRGIKLTVFVQPKSAKNQIVGLHNGALKIKIAALPVDGKANTELTNYLAQLLDIPKRQIEILKGDTGRNKIVEIVGLTIEDVQKKLGITFS